MSVAHPDGHRGRAAGRISPTAARSATATTPSSTSCATSACNSRQYIAQIEARERTRTGIASLKVRFNNVFGYYIEISKANLQLRARRITSASRRW